MTSHRTLSAQTVVPLDLLHTLIGKELGPTDWIDVDQDLIDSFAELTRDRQWIHTDVERASRGPFHGTIAHGYLTLSLVAGLMQSLLRIDGARSRINYGVNRVRFPAVVPSGSRVRATLELTSLDTVTAGLQATYVVTVRSDRADKPVCVAETLTLMIGGSE